MKNTYLLLIIFLINVNCFSQAPSIQWQKSFGGSLDETATSIKQTNDGGYIVAGKTNSTDGDVTGNTYSSLDFWILKLNSTGDIQWKKTLGGSSEDYAFSINQTSDGGYIVAGSTKFSFTGGIPGNHGDYDFWVVKLNATGNIEWQKALGGSGADNALEIQQTLDGGFIVAGDSNSNNGNLTSNNGSCDAWIVKLDTTGNIEWQKNYGGSNCEYLSSIKQTNDGGYIFAATTYSNDGDVMGNQGGSDYWIVKINSLGTIEWQKTYGGSGFDAVYNIQITNDGGYVFAGGANSNNGDVSGNHGLADFWIVKTNLMGVIEWQKALGGSYMDRASKIINTIDNGYVVAGLTTSNDGDVSGLYNFGFSDFWIVKLNSHGDLQWQKAIGGSNFDEAYSIEQTSDNGFIISGFSFSSDGNLTSNNGGKDFWIVKLEPEQLSINDFQEDSIKIYPNPSTSILNIELSNGDQIDKILVIDISGKIIVEETINLNSINTSKLENGLYFLTLFSKGKSYKSKFIKK